MYYQFVLATGSRLHMFYVEVMMEKDEVSPSVCQYRVRPVGGVGELYCKTPLQGRYVRIRKEGPVFSEDVLVLCEVDVFGTKVGTVFQFGLQSM